MTIVLVPVMANTVQRSVISAYHLSVPRGGISLGPMYRCRNVVCFVVVVVVVAVVAVVDVVEEDVIGSIVFFVLDDDDDDDNSLRLK